MTVSPVLLAAGSSQRFGSDKLLYQLNHQGIKKPLILHTLQRWLMVFDRLNLVVRPNNEQLLDVLEHSAVRSQITLIAAADAERGMSASLISGVTANKMASAWLIGLADMPYVAVTVIRDSVRALNAGAAITLPTFNGQRGHPVGFASCFLPQLQLLTGDKGARELITASPELITSVNSPDNGILLDIDTRRDLSD